MDALHGRDHAEACRTVECRPGPNAARARSAIADSVLLWMLRNTASYRSQHFAISPVPDSVRAKLESRSRWPVRRSCDVLPDLHVDPAAVGRVCAADRRRAPAASAPRDPSAPSMYPLIGAHGQMYRPRRSNNIASSSPPVSDSAPQHHPQAAAPASPSRPFSETDPSGERRTGIFERSDPFRQGFALGQLDLLPDLGIRARLPVQSVARYDPAHGPLSSCAPSFNNPVGSPCASRKISPPGGSGVFLSTPASRSASAFANPACPLACVSQTGLCGETRLKLACTGKPSTFGAGVRSHLA